jgi:glutamate racemase
MAPGAPVGVYDSGFGGLTVLRELRRTLPELDYVYLGDSGRAPYGGRDVDTILDFAEQCVERLFGEGCRTIIVACHTVSCVALRHLQHRYGNAERRVLGVTIPAAEAAVAQTRGHIGFLGTARTVASHTFRTEVHKLAPKLTVSEVAASLLAPLVEEAWEDTEIARLTVQRYLAKFAGIDTLVLGCTHYPLLERAFRELAPPEVAVLNPASQVAECFAAWRARHPGLAPAGSGRLRLLSSGDTARFAASAVRFLGEKPPAIEHIAERGGRLAPCAEGSEPIGQVVRK